MDNIGNIYIGDGNQCRVRKVDGNGIITTVAGNGSYGYSGDGGPATQAQLAANLGVTVDELGNIYLADNGNARVRKVDVNGIITTIAGNGIVDYSGDGGLATQASFNGIPGMALDGHGNMYIPDQFNHRVRRVIMPPSVISTVPDDGYVNVPIDQVISIAFNEDIQVIPPESNISLFDEKRQRFVLTDKDVLGNVLTIIRVNEFGTRVNLEKNTNYTVSIPSFTIKDLAGNGMIVDNTFSFTTVKNP